jgi:hypothetical protein
MYGSAAAVRYAGAFPSREQISPRLAWIGTFSSVFSLWRGEDNRGGVGQLPCQGNSRLGSSIPHQLHQQGERLFLKQICPRGCSIHPERRIEGPGAGGRKKGERGAGREVVASLSATVTCRLQTAKRRPLILCFLDGRRSLRDLYCPSARPGHRTTWNLRWK